MRAAYASVLAALVFALTYFVRVPVPALTGGGYVNLGDTAVYLSAALLGVPLALAPAALGSALADLAAGAPLYILPTAIIKALMAFVFAFILRKKSGALWYLLGALAGGAVMDAGYSLFALAMFGKTYALAECLANLGQLAANAALTACAPSIVKRAAPLLHKYGRNA